MREIKFRAWDGEHVSDVIKIRNEYDEGDNILCLVLTLAWSLKEIIVADWYKKNENRIMQYTGLKDKNGKEIYEGDIVRYERRHRRPEVPVDVFFREVKFISYNDSEEYYDYTHLGWSAGGDRTLPDVASGCEVVGNIYENPELLTDNK